MIALEVVLKQALFGQRQKESSRVICRLRRQQRQSDFFWGKSVARMGTKKHPAIVRVATQERAGQILELCNQHGIQVIIGIEPNQQEDITDVERILRRPAPVQVVKAPPRIAGNDYCSRSSGKKYKKSVLYERSDFLAVLGVRPAHSPEKWPISRARLQSCRQRVFLSGNGA